MTEKPVTDALAKQAMEAYCAVGPARVVYTAMGLERMKAALLAVAPLIRRAALEEAAAWHTQGALLAEREAENTTAPERRGELLLHARRERKAATAIRALGSPA